MANQQITKKDRVITLIIGIMAIIVVLGSYSAIKFYATRPEQLKINPIINQKEIEKAKQEVSVDLEKYKNYRKIDLYPNGLVTPQNLIRVCEDKKRISDQCNSEIAKITNVVTTSGKIKDAYLYIKAGVSRNNASFGTLTNFDSIWFYIDSSNFGGHLLRSQAITRRQSEDGVTELLYNLKKIPFTKLPYRDDAFFNIKNALDGTLNIPGKHFIGAFVSTLGTGKIFEMKIGYNSGLIKIKK